jgi:hypothetical protein
MRIDVTKSEFETIINALKGVMLRCDSKLREQLARRLNWQLLRRSLEQHRSHTRNAHSKLSRLGTGRDGG